MRLHNFAIDEDGVTGFRQFSIRDDDDDNAAGLILELTT